MTKPPKEPSVARRQRHDNLTEEDAELWGFVTRSVRRLDEQKEKKSRHSVRTDIPDTGQFPTAVPSAAPPLSKQAQSTSEAYTKRTTLRHPEVVDFDRREARHLARGRIEIEARIDLHGLRQAEAHRRLTSFLRRAQDSGMRHVLVITGKGRFDEDRHDLPFHETLDRAPRGVLRRSVPLWLEEPALRGIVLSYREAAANHGGSGALYVRLRSSTRAGE